MRPLRGSTLLELLVSFGLFSLLTVVLVTAMRDGSKIFGRASGNSLVQGELSKGKLNLTEDLERTAFGQISTTTVAGTLSAGKDGDAIWFLSPVDPVSGAIRRKADGTPFYQTNVLYYLIVPNQHSSLYGYTCAGGSDAAGYDDRCPHKVLVRKVIDNPPATNPADETTEEKLLPVGSIAQYLTHPVGFDTSGMNAEPGLRSVQVRAHNLLYFHVQLAPQPLYPREVRVDLRSTDVRAAEKEINVGSFPLGQSHFTSQNLFSAFPQLP